MDNLRHRLLLCMDRRYCRAAVLRPLGPVVEADKLTIMKSAALQFNDVCFSYPDGKEALSHVSFAIGEGERVALVGLNGAGKSTLLLLADALLLPTSGRIEIAGIELTDKSAAECRRKAGIVFQDSDDQLFMPTVEADVAFGPRNMGFDEAEVARRVESALRQTGCTALASRPPFRLSGGQRRMASIATVLSMTPDIILFDEPTSGLDFEARARFITIADRLPHTMLMSTHDIELAARLCRRAIVIDSGAVSYDGPIDLMPYPFSNHSNDFMP